MFNKAVLYGAALAAIPALALDVVFMVDESGSMGNEQATLKAQIPNIFAGIQAVDANSRAALVGFGTSSGGGDPRLRQALTTSQAAFTSAAQSLTANGSFEPGFRAIIETANDLIEGLTVGIAGPYCAVIFTDEDSDGAETQAAAQTALSNSAGALFSVTNGQADYDNIAVKFYDLNTFSGSTATTIINDIIANCAVVVNEATFPPTTSPTAAPSTTPTVSPTSRPTVSPTAAPSTTPTVSPTAAPSTTPTVSPTATPTVSPTAAPSQSPTVSPTAAPTVSPIASCGTVMGRDVDSNTYLYSDASHPLNSIGWGIYWKDDAFTGDAVGATKSGVIVTGAKRVCVGDWSAEVLQGGKVTFTMTMKSPWLIRSPHLYVSTVRPTSGSPGLFPYKEGELETPFDTSNMYQYQNSVTWTVTPVSNDSKKYVECLFSDRRLLRANNKKGGNDEESEAVDCSGQPLWVVLHASVSSFEGCDYELMDLSEYVGQAECPNNS